MAAAVTELACWTGVRARRAARSEDISLERWLCVLRVIFTAIVHFESFTTIYALRYFTPYVSSRAKTMLPWSSERKGKLYTAPNTDPRFRAGGAPPPPAHSGARRDELRDEPLREALERPSRVRCSGLSRLRSHAEVRESAEERAERFTSTAATGAGDGGMAAGLAACSVLACDGATLLEVATTADGLPCPPPPLRCIAVSRSTRAASSLANSEARCLMASASVRPPVASAAGGLGCAVALVSMRV